MAAGDTVDDRPQGVRITWNEVAEPVRRAVEVAVGSTVVHATNHRGGFSPGTAARVTLADDGVVFVKAVSSALNETAVGMHREEAAVLDRLPAAMPAPRLRGFVDTTVDGVAWVALVTDHVDGRLPSTPWVPDELARVLDLLTVVADLGTPNPIPGLPLAASHDLGGLATLDDAMLDPWSAAHIDDLVALESTWRDAVVGDSLQHFDVRADNVLLGPDRDWLVDWPSARGGAPWLDLMGLLPSAVLDGLPDPEAVWSAHPLGRGAEPERADAFLAALTGYFLGRSIRPPPPGIPTVRAFQRAQGEISLAWLGRRLRSR